MIKPLHIKLLFTFIFIQYALTSSAQTGSKSETINVFGSSAPSKESNGFVKNIIKINPTLLFNGEIPLLYERMITKKISVEIGAGYTKENYFEVTKFIKDYNQEEVNVDSKATAGYSIRAAFRFYLRNSEDAPEGLYIAPEMLYRVYNRSSPYHDELGHVIEGDNASTYTKNLNVRLIIGRQVCFDNNITYESYMGIGLEARTFNYLQLNRSGTIYTNELRTDKQVIPVLALGIKLGFGF